MYPDPIESHCGLLRILSASTSHLRRQRKGIAETNGILPALIDHRVDYLRTLAGCYSRRRQITSCATTLTIPVEKVKRQSITVLSKLFVAALP